METPNLESQARPLVCLSQYNKFTRCLGSRIHSWVEKILSIDALNWVYSQVEHVYPASLFNKQLIKLLKLQLLVQTLPNIEIPATGPLVMVANHPFGACEAILLHDWLSNIRSDTKFLANFILNRVKPLKEIMIAVDPFASTNTLNKIGLRHSITWLKNQHALIIFPAGEVSRFNFKKMRVCDNQWHPNIARLIRLTKANVLPVYVHGRNSLLFQSLSFLHDILGLLLLPREFIKQSGKTVKISVGNIIQANEIANFKSDKTLINHLQKSVTSLITQYHLES